MTPPMRRAVPLRVLLLPLLLAALAACQPSPVPADATADATAEAAVEAAPATLYLVRHAEKADDGTDDPPLTDAGTARAQHLAAMLADAGIDAVYATRYRRNQETAAPLAEALGVPVTTYAAQGAALADTLRARHAGQDVLVVGHSNTVPQLLDALVGADAYDDLSEQEYDALFVVTAWADTADVALLRVP